MGVESWPSFQKFPEIPKEEKTTTEPQKNQQKSDLYKHTRAEFSNLFDKYSDPKERVDTMLKEIEPLFKHIDKKIIPEDDVKKIKTTLLACESTSEKQQFLDEVMLAMKPFLDLKETNLEEFEEAQALTMNERGGFTEINRLLSYGKDKNIIHFHAPAGKAVDNKITLYRSGLRKLAGIVNDDPEIKEITATSPLVASHPGLFTGAGFKIEDVSDEFKQEHFAGDERETKKASIDREEFLKRFLKKEK
jgi:hypothetical protein